MKYLAICILILASASCTQHETIDHSEEKRPDRDMGENDLAIANTLVIDASVHTGSYQDGTPYEGVYGKTVTYSLQAFGPSAPIALAHASWLATRMGLRVSTHALITHIILQGGASCASDTPRGGCFALLHDPHLREIRDLYPERFAPITEEALQNFGLGALVYIWRLSYAHAIFGKYEGDVARYMSALSPGDEARYGFFAHIYSPYAPALERVFPTCGSRALRACLGDTAQPGQVDLLTAHKNITQALEKAPVSSARWRRDQVEAYLQEIAPLHTADTQDILDAAFSGADTLSTPGAERMLLEALTQALGVPPTPETFRRELCTRQILSRTAPGCQQ